MAGAPAPARALARHSRHCSGGWREAGDEDRVGKEEEMGWGGASRWGRGKAGKGEPAHRITGAPALRAAGPRAGRHRAGRRMA